MSLDGSRVPKLSDGSRKFIPKKQKKINDGSFCRKDQEDLEVVKIRREG